MNRARPLLAPLIVGLVALILHYGLARWTAASDPLVPISQGRLWWLLQPMSLLALRLYLYLAWPAWLVARSFEIAIRRARRGTAAGRAPTVQRATTAPMTPFQSATSTTSCPD